jgi:fatty-acyl-CoA synthase
MTESAGLLSIGPVRAPRVPGSTGLRLPYSEVKAVRWENAEADLSRPCAPGETGVIVARGPHVGPGYTDPKRNAGMFEDGWLISGDLGHVDESGNIFVTGRAKDVIIRGAHNIDPGMIEDAFLANPAVSMCAAVSEPDAHAGELPVVFIALRPGMPASAEAILEEVRPRIAERAAVPKRVTILDAVPVTAIGKVYKPALRARAAEVKIAEMLSDLDCLVRAEDRAGAVHLKVVLNRKELEIQVRQRLTAIALPYEIAWQPATPDR